jgi:hypothetical protein
MLLIELVRLSLRREERRKGGGGSVDGAEGKIRDRLDWDFGQRVAVGVEVSGR